MSTPTIEVDLSKKCVECGKGGAMPSGICLRCTADAIKGKPMLSAAARAIARRMRELAPRRRGR